MWSSASVLYCPRGFVAQQGANDGDGRPCVPANEDVAFAYGYDDRKVPSASSPVTLNVAKDPNAKYGVYGATQATVLPDQTLDYTITCENEGSGTAYGVYIVDTLSQHLDETTLNLGGQGQYSAALRQVSWDIGDLAPKGSPGSKAERSFTIKPKAGLPNGTEILNQGVVYFPSVPETTPTNVVINTIQAVAAIPQTVQAVAGSAQPITLAGKGAGALSYSIVDAPLYGVLSGTPPNVSYTADGGYSGADLFTFRVSERRPAERTGGGEDQRCAEPRRHDAAGRAVDQPSRRGRIAHAVARQLHRLPGGWLLSAGDDPVFRGVGCRDCEQCERRVARGRPDGQQDSTVCGRVEPGAPDPAPGPGQRSLLHIDRHNRRQGWSRNALAAPFSASFKLREPAQEERRVYLPLVVR